MQTHVNDQMMMIVLLQICKPMSVVVEQLRECRA